MTTTYPARRTRASHDEMAERHDAIVAIAREQQPCTIRQVFYRAVVAGVPSITKDQRGYEKVQRACLDLRRSGRIPWDWIVDTSRTVYGLEVWQSLDDFAYDAALMYRRDLWADVEVPVEVWCESESIASTVRQVTYKWRVDLFPTRGQCSESYAWSAVNTWRSDGRPRRVLYIGDHDPAGLDIEAALIEKLDRFGGGDLLAEFHRVGVTWQQAVELDLPGTTPKAKSASQRERYPYPLSIEAEALPPQLLRDMLDDALKDSVAPGLIQSVRRAEDAETDLLRNLSARNLQRLREADGHE